MIFKIVWRNLCQRNYSYVFQNCSAYFWFIDARNASCTVFVIFLKGQFTLFLKFHSGCLNIFLRGMRLTFVKGQVKKSEDKSMIMGRFMIFLFQFLIDHCAAFNFILNSMQGASFVKNDYDFFL